jgi:hypothetical protein
MVCEYSRGYTCSCDSHWSDMEQFHLPHLLDFYSQFSMYLFSLKFKVDEIPFCW